MQILASFVFVLLHTSHFFALADKQCEDVWTVNGQVPNLSPQQNYRFKIKTLQQHSMPYRTITAIAKCRSLCCKNKTCDRYSVTEFGPSKMCTIYSCLPQHSCLQRHAWKSEPHAISSRIRRHNNESSDRDKRRGNDNRTRRRKKTKKVKQDRKLGTTPAPRSRNDDRDDNDTKETVERHRTTTTASPVSTARTTPKLSSVKVRPSIKHTEQSRPTTTHSTTSSKTAKHETTTKRVLTHQSTTTKKPPNKATSTAATATHTTSKPTTTTRRPKTVVNATRKTSTRITSHNAPKHKSHIITKQKIATTVSKGNSNIKSTTNKKATTTNKSIPKQTTARPKAPESKTSINKLRKSTQGSKASIPNTTPTTKPNTTSKKTPPTKQHPVKRPSSNMTLSHIPLRTRLRLMKRSSMALLVCATLSGIILLCIAIILVLKRCYYRYDRNQYTELNQLIDGLYD